MKMTVIANLRAVTSDFKAVIARLSPVIADSIRNP